MVIQFFQFIEMSAQNATSELLQPVNFCFQYTLVKETKYRVLELIKEQQSQLKS